MPTLEQLRSESYWQNEFTPNSLQDLGRKISAHWGLKAGSIGTVGDANHLRGYHRSRNWVLHSRYCTNREYSVTETGGNRSGGDGDAVCAMDVSAPHDVLVYMCRRLDAAVKAGRLEKVTEWYGQLNDDTVVDGWNNVLNRPASSDSSHLTHLHLSFDRGRVFDNHDDVFVILTTGGTVSVWDEDVIPAPSDAKDYATNKTWKASSALADALLHARGADKKAADIAAHLTELGPILAELHEHLLTADDVATALVANDGFRNLVTEAVHNAGLSIPSAEQIANALIAAFKAKI